MILCLINPSLNCRQDLKVVITSILMTNCNTFTSIVDELVLVRMVRLIGYYPTAIYFSFIQKLMGYSKVFLCEGLAAFNRISKNKEYLEIFPLLHLVFAEIIDYIEVNDSIFENLINENYEKVLKPNLTLYSAVLKKICDTFCSSKSLKNDGILALNWIEKMLTL